MPTFNAIASVVTGLKVHPEPQSLPEALIGASPVDQAAGYNRLKEVAAVANGQAKAVAEALAAQLPNGALRYGDSVYRPAGERGSTKVVDEGKWWPKVVEGLKNIDRPEALLAALYPASEVRMGGLEFLATAVGEDPKTFRKEHIRYEAATSSLSVMPIHKAPLWAQKLSEGQVSTKKPVEDTSTADDGRGWFLP